MEIDLAELEWFEKQLADKRKINNDNRDHESNIDELDDYLDRLAIDIKTRENAKVNNAPSTSAQLIDQNTSLSSVDGSNTNLNTQQSSSSVYNSSSNQAISYRDNQLQKTSLPLLLYGLIGILFFINSVHCKEIPQTHTLNHTNFN